MNFPIKILAISLAMVFFCGCYAIKVSQFIPTPPTRIGFTSSKSASVNFKNNIKYYSKWLRDPMLTEALDSALTNAKIFSKIQKEGDYAIQGTIVHCFQTPIGLVFSTDMDVEYKITNLLTSQEIFLDTIRCSSKANFGDAFSGMKRTKIGFERAVRDNIGLFVERLSKGDLKE